MNAAQVVAIDNNETELFFLAEQYRGSSAIHLSLGDVRDRDKLHEKMDGIDVVLHAAALKHVILCEQSPRDAVQTNVVGTQNVIDAAIANDVRRVVFTSSDKAVNPTNVMGTSKLMGERLITSANALRRRSSPVFASTRFGNVLGSRGSVIPIFQRQIAVGGPVTLTSPDMTRFVMTLHEAASLVIDSVFLANGGEVFVTKMPAIRIEDLAAVMIEELAPRYGFRPNQIQIEMVGAKAGEKMYEELLSAEETRRTIELDKYFAVIPAFTSVYRAISYEYPEGGGLTAREPYNSATQRPLSRDAIRAFLAASITIEGS